MERPGLEDFLRMTSQWGIPPPAPPSLAPMAPPTGFAAGGIQTGLPPVPLAPPPALAQPAPEAAPAPVDYAASGYAPAAFAPPRQIAQPRNADMFGDYMQTLGLRAPAAAAPPLGAMPTAPQQSPPMLAPQQQAMGQDYGARPAPGRMAQPEMKVSPALARRWPSSTRMNELLDNARQRRGWY